MPATMAMPRLYQPSGKWLVALQNHGSGRRSANDALIANINASTAIARVFAQWTGNARGSTNVRS